MHSLPPRLQSLLDAIKHCVKQSDGKTFLHGNTLLCQLTGNEELLIDKTVNLIVSYEAGFHLQQLYQRLTHQIVISKEVENTNERYSFISSGYEIRMNLVFQFDPTRIGQAKKFGRFNIDVLFYDLQNKELKYSPEINPDTSVISNINDHWEFEDVMGFVRKVGTLAGIKIDESQQKRLRGISLGTMTESLSISWGEEIEDILLLRHPGFAFKFLADTFVDGMPWTFKILVDYMISLNVPINEEANINTVFNEKKYNLANLYNDYFLADKKSFETPDEIQHRLTTTLKLLFDSPNLVIAKPYVNRIRTMAGGVLGRCCLGTNAGGSIVFFGCGENIEEEECLGLPVFCQGNDPCLKDHPSFSHIPENNWNVITVTHREWCPDQSCPDTNNIHCLEEPASTSSSSGGTP